MRCSDISRLSTSYVDGELDERRSSAVRGHLRTCAACRDLVDDEVAIRDGFSGLDAHVDPPGSVWEGIESRLAEAEIADADRSRLWLLWPRFRPYGAVALVGACAALLFYWGMNREERPADPAEERTATVVEAAPDSDTTAGPALAQPAVWLTHEQARELEIRAAAARHREAVIELRTLAAELPGGAPERVAAAGRFEGARQTLISAGTEDLSAQYALHRSYREEERFLTSIIFDRSKPSR